MGLAAAAKSLQSCPTRCDSIDVSPPGPPVSGILQARVLEWGAIAFSKWAVGSIIMNKASGGDGIPVELFQILKDDAVKVLHSICQQIWKTGKCQFSVQCQRMHKLLHNCTYLTH